MSRNPAVREVDEAIRAHFPNSTKVRWTGARVGGWSGEGKGIIVAYEGERPYFEGYPASKTQPERGPALCILLNDADPKHPRRSEVWAAPSEVEKLDDEPEEVAA